MNAVYGQLCPVHMTVILMLFKHLSCRDIQGSASCLASQVVKGYVLLKMLVLITFFFLGSVPPNAMITRFSVKNLKQR